MELETRRRGNGRLIRQGVSRRALTPLLRSEQMSVASGDMISSLPSGSVVGDRAGGARLQIERPFQSSNTVMAPYMFAAAARTHIEQATVLEAPSTRLNSFGVGLRGTFAPTNANSSVGFSLEYARTHSNIKQYEGNSLGFRITLRR